MIVSHTRHLKHFYFPRSLSQEAPRYCALIERGGKPQKEELMAPGKRRERTGNPRTTALPRAHRVHSPD